MFLRATRPAAFVIAVGCLLAPQAWRPAAAQTVSPPDVGMHAGLDVILDGLARYLPDDRTTRP